MPSKRFHNTSGLPLRLTPKQFTANPLEYSIGEIAARVKGEIIVRWGTLPFLDLIYKAVTLCRKVRGLGSPVPRGWRVRPVCRWAAPRMFWSAIGDIDFAFREWPSGPEADGDRACRGVDN